MFFAIVVGHQCVVVVEQLVDIATRPCRTTTAGRQYFWQTSFDFLPIQQSNRVQDIKEHHDQTVQPTQQTVRHETHQEQQGYQVKETISKQ